MLFLTKEQVSTMSVAACQKHLRKLARTYKLDKPLQEYMTPELWNDLDNITNTLAYLDDRIRWLTTYQEQLAQTE